MEGVMKTHRLLLVFLFSLCSFHVYALKIYAGLDVGYYSGGGAIGRISFFQINKKFPLAIDLAFGYFYQTDSGNAEGARKIFINDNTGGTIEKDGSLKVLSLNLKYPLSHKRGTRLYIYGGPRYVRYTAHYAFIGNNEAFDVYSNPWGIGGGLELHVPVNKKWFLSLNAGVDSYFKSKIEGHAKYYYTPDGVDENPRNDYTYSDADEAVNQPKIVVKVLLGIHYRIF